ncbi:Hsp20/alpha crystallin family protein [Candidatus Falkowbacteria bacterium]|nr:Hsp20/alpha crystallin family protein [Candidatus Falkowbacteria bacterium]
MAKAKTKKKTIWSRLTGVEDEEIENQEVTEEIEVEDKVEVDESDESEVKPKPQIKEDSVSVQKEEKEDADKEDWMEENYEGQLSVDVYQTEDKIIIKSTIAGVKPEDVDVSIENDMLTIRGQRRLEETISEENYFYQECYWGGFSRSIILPLEVVTDKIDASLKDGVLTVALPKAKKSKGISIKVKKED